MLTSNPTIFTFSFPASIDPQEDVDMVVRMLHPVPVGVCHFGGNIIVTGPVEYGAFAKATLEAFGVL